MGEVQVLVVDDSAFMRKMVSDIVSRHPRMAVAGTARNGREGLAKVLALKPDVVTLDVEMPDMDGLDVIKRFKREKPDTEVMVITGYSSVPSAVEAIKGGAKDYLAKPFTEEEFMERIENVLPRPLSRFPREP